MAALVRNTLLIVALIYTTGLFGQEREQSPSKTTAKTSSDESAIRANVTAFVNAFNAGDAKAVASLFSPEAQVIDEDGKTSQGRDAIEKTFAAIFADSPQPRIRVDVDSIRFIGSALAIETGRAKVTSNPGEAPDVTRYTTVHIKSPAGKWLMGFVRDTQGAELTNQEQLKQLEWMIGDWIDESPESVVVSSCKWSDNKHFIVQDIKIRMQGRDTMHLNQRIGWDPLTKQIKSWLFDSEGGYSESFWTHDGDHWLVKATAVRRDGTTASMTNIFTPTGKNSYTWRSTDRVLGSEVLPPMDVKVVRKAPEVPLPR